MPSDTIRPLETMLKNYDYSSARACLVRCRVCLLKILKAEIGDAGVPNAQSQRTPELGG